MVGSGDVEFCQQSQMPDAAEVYDTEHSSRSTPSFTDKSVISLHSPLSQLVGLRDHTEMTHMTPGTSSRIRMSHPAWSSSPTYRSIGSGWAEKVRYLAPVLRD